MTISPNRLKALKRGAVPAGKTLNPYGSAGNTFRGRYRASYFKIKLKPAWRPWAVRRKRLKLLASKAKALEAHELQQRAREAAGDALSTLVEISKNKRAPESSRIAASTAIIDRGYGKASQTSITASLTSGKKADLTGDELEKRTQLALKRVEELTNRAPKAGKSTKRPADLRKYN